MQTESTSDKKLMTTHLYRHRIKSKTADIDIESTLKKSSTNNRHRLRKCENIDIESKISDIDTSQKQATGAGPAKTVTAAE
jgi:hypothetical protein